jgi:predicted DNA-binding antitoxin AbrB/MazE fold protein
VTQILEATFDGEVFKPLGVVQLTKNARVQLHIKTTRSFLDTDEALELEGPSDWSNRVDKCLYGQATPEQ